MKKLIIILVAVLLVATVWAQSPQKMSYQAVIRNSSNELVTNHVVGMRVSILQGSVTGQLVYTETQTPATNANGLVSIEIGGESGFEFIDWASGPYFVKTETDPAGGTRYSITGTSQLLSVPFALHAKTAESISGTLAENDPVFGAWNKSTGVSITASQVSDFQTRVANNSAVAANTAKNSYPLSDATKLAGIATGAEVNVNADWNATSGDAQILNKPVGTNNGDMLYWYGTHWVVIPAGTDGQILTMVNGVPTWSGASSTITTTEVTSITAHTATSGGNIISDGGSGIIARGVCWSTSSNPTTADSKTTDGSGIGSFTSSLTGLTASTLYYVRAYATNSAGTTYGDQKQFTTTGGTGGDGTFDYEGRTYAYKTIGTQTWMTQNLAYLPAVSPGSAGSNTTLYYYVYGYEGSTVSLAKAEANYTTYGVLYNWEAAKTACPSGWHLPGDEEWSILTDYLINNGYGFGGSGNDIGKSMASTSGWASSSTAGEIGNNQASNNSSGFTALPGGYRINDGWVVGLGFRAYFWSTSEGDALTAYSRTLGNGENGIYRDANYRSSGYSVRCLKN